MKKPHYKKIMLKILVNFYEIIENPCEGHYFVSIVCIIFFFFQTFSFLAGTFLKASTMKSDYMLVFLKIAYFSNFSNIIVNFDSYIATSIFHILFLVLNLMSLIWIYQRTITNLATKKIDQIIGEILLLNNWIFFIPILSFHIHETYIWKNNLSEKNDENGLKFLNFIISIIEIPLTLGLSFFLNYFHRDFKFHDYRMLSLRYDSLNLCIWLLRVSQPLIYILISDCIDIFLVTNGSIILISLFYSIRNPKFGEKFLINLDIATKIYFSLLWILIVFLYVDLLSEPDFIYINGFFILFAFKLGLKRNNSYFLNNLLSLNINEFPIEICEILTQMHFSPKEKKRNIILFYNYFIKHYKDCTDLECLTEKKNLISYFDEDYERQTRSLSKLIIIHIKSFYQKDKKMEKHNFEYYFFKWITCVIYLEINPLKSYYELITNEAYFVKKNLYFSSMIHYLKKKLNRQISFFFTQKIKIEENKNYSEYFESYKIKIEMQTGLIALLNEKIKFFKSLDLQNNITPLEQISHNMLKLAPKINSYKFILSNLSKTQNSFLKIMHLKFSSIFYCGFLNSLNTSNQFERHYNDLLKSSGYSRTNFTFHEINFFDEKIVTCDASFLSTSDGILRKSSLKEKFKNLFGYNHELKRISDLMPAFMREAHSIFFQNYINSDQETFHRKVERVFSFGITKEHVVFPLRVCFSFNLDIYNDFIMRAAIRSLETENFMCFLCKKNGDILNISKSMFYIFQEKFNIPEPEFLNLLNLFNFIPCLQETFKKQPLPSSTYLGEFIIPLKIKELVEKLQNNSKFQFDQCKGNENSKENTPMNLSVQNYFFENTIALIKFNILFNLNYYCHELGDKNNPYLEYYMIEIKKMAQLDDCHKKNFSETNNFGAKFNLDRNLIVPEKKLNSLPNKDKEPTFEAANLKDLQNKILFYEVSERKNKTKKEKENFKNDFLGNEIKYAVIEN